MKKSFSRVVLVYIEPMKMNKAVQIRMPMAVWDHLAKLAEQRAPGTKVTSLIREAIHEVYFDRPSNEKNPNKSKKNWP